MIIQKPIYEDFDFEQVYHLFTTVSGNELIFRKEENYHFFLKQISKYLLPYLDIYAYCLLPKQFSFLVCFHSFEKICLNKKMEFVELPQEKVHKFLMKPISNLLNSYAKAYNKMYQRKGALFIDYIKREKFDDEKGLMEIFRDIHQMPVQGKISEDISDWKFSSYKGYVHSYKSSQVNRTFMSSFFGNSQDCIEYHKVF